MLEHRELSKLKSTYVDALPEAVDANTGRVHTSYSQTGSVTGRLSSNNPNLQNIPIRTETGRRVRNGFIAEEGNLLLSVDYSQVELRLVAVMAGDVTMLFATLPSVTAQIENGRLRALAVTTGTRAPQLPQVPTMMQAGVEGFETSVWIGALAPRGTPAGIVDKLQKAIVQALATPEFSRLLQHEGYQAVGSTPAQMAAKIQSESAKWARVIKEAGIQPD